MTTNLQHLRLMFTITGGSLYITEEPLYKGSIGKV